MARVPTQQELAAFLIGHGIVDFVSGGRLTNVERNALWKVIKKLGPPAVTTTGRLAGTAAMALPRVVSTAARGTRFVAMRHPYIAAAVVTYEVVKNREQIAALAREGWEVIEPVAQQIYDVAEPSGIYDIRPAARRPFVEKFVKKRPSKYNRAMSAAMKAVKASSKGGKKGTISNPKSTFKTVSKAVSKVNRGSRVGKTGITGIAARAAKRIIGKVKRRLKK